MITVDQETKRAFRDGSTHKRWTIQVYTDDSPDFVISNSNLISESITYDERLCSGDELQFGLCEGAEFSFQYFGLENIRDKRVRPFVSVEKFDGTWSADIPLGWFTVKECSRQASTGIIKASCYNKLGDEFLDDSYSEELFTDFTEGTITAMDIITRMFDLAGINQVRTGVEYPTETIMESAYPLPKMYYLSQIEPTPINERRYHVEGLPGSRTIDGLYLHVKTYRYNVRVEDYKRVEALKGSLTYIEQGFADYMRDIFGMCTSYDTFENIIDAMCNSNISGQGNFDGRFGANLGALKLFSTIQKDYNDAHSITPNINTLSDAMRLTRGRHNMHINIPIYISDSATAGAGTITPIYYDPGNRRYETDTGETAEFPYLTYSNGEPVTIVFPARYYKYENLPTGMTKQIALEDMPDFTTRDILAAVYETACQFGMIDRITDLFFGNSLKTNIVYPAETLYPSISLYPSAGGGSERIEAAMYEKLWADEGNIRKFKNLILTYKGLEPDPDYPDDREKDKEVDKTIEKVVNSDGTDDYICSDNWLFKNLVWEDADAENAAEIMAEKMQGLQWFPFELWCAGLPYLETGDMVEIHMGENAYRSYVLRRNLKGLQNVHDEYINGSLDIF